MMIASRRGCVVVLSRLAAVAGALIAVGLGSVSRAAEPDPAVEARIQAAIPDIEAYIAAGMKAFDVPGLAIGIVANDKLVYAKGFCVRSKSGGQPVDSHTVFQIGSTTKAFLAATLAIMVDRGKFHWDDRIVDLDPGFQLKDPWVTREFRVYDLLAQRSGLPPYANDALGLAGLDRDVVERYPIKSGPALGLRVVADDKRDGAHEFAAMVPIEQIDQAVIVLRHEQGDAVRAV